MVKRTYIKIIGPPLLKAIKALEKIAVDMPEFCIMDTVISTGLPAFAKQTRRRAGPSHMHDPILGDFIKNYYSGSEVVINQERCETILSGSPQMLGEYDFFFEWNKEFNTEDLNDLIERVDAALSPLGCMYSMTTE